MVEILTNGPILCTSPQLPVQWDHTGSWKSAMMENLYPGNCKCYKPGLWFLLIVYSLENNDEEIT